MKESTSPVFFSNSVDDVIEHFSAADSSKIFLLADTNTLGHCWPVLAGSLPKVRDSIEILEVPPGEDSKCLEVAAQLWATLTELKADRQSIMINLGGGMITDLGGFVASTFKRGIPFYNFPTSVLGQVDAAIGGKTGIDLGSLKNQIGTYAAAQSTFVCTEFLSTLPQNEINNGFAEIIKHGLIADSDFFQKLESLESLLPEIVVELVEEAARIKIQISESDPLEKGERKKLNFGHTFGHAVESLFLENEPTLSHGEAVAIGIIFETLLSKKKLHLSDEESKRIEKVVSRFFETPLKKSLNKEIVWANMQHDKKNKSGQVNCTLLKKIGEAQVDNELSKEDFETVWSQFESFQKWISE